MSKTSKIFVPPEGYHAAKQLQNAYQDWLPSLEADLFITLNFNRPVTIQGARSQLKEFVGRFDRSLLGRKYLKTPSSQRTSGSAAIENPDRNTHFHLLLRYPPKATTLSF